MAVDPDVIAGRVADCGSVVRLSGGMFGEVATYLPGRRIPGVRIKPGEVEIHVVARWGVAIPDLADQVRRAVLPVAEGSVISVFVDDIDLPPDEPARAHRAGQAASVVAADDPPQPPGGAVAAGRLPHQPSGGA